MLARRSMVLAIARDGYAENVAGVLQRARTRRAPFADDWGGVLGRIRVADGEVVQFNLSRPASAASAPVPPPATASQQFEDGAVPAARFTDPGRRAKLASAFPEIDRIFAAFRDKERVPGLAYGVVVDGELLHVQGIGVRDLESKAPVDADTVFRIA